MVQFNTEAAVPFFSSTKGYGLLWDSNAWTKLNPPTGDPLTFTAARPSATGPMYPVADGTSVALATCDTESLDQACIYTGQACIYTDPACMHIYRCDTESLDQAWSYNASSQRLTKQARFDLT